ncbi:MAG TPA: mercuric reductase [Ktedonobacterales bacterium]|nr:mercuric reductase [Ktedonobacterales bacterium]
MTTYDAIILGSGQAGGPLSTTLAGAGWKIALIECEHVGGTCINEGCTPTKTMVASARVAYLAKRGADYGVHTGPISIDMARVRQRKRDIVESFRSGSERRITGAKGVELLMGAARFIGPKTLEVHMHTGESRQITAPTIFLNTGARPSAPDIAGIESVPALNSTTIMEVDVVPEHLLIVGGGYIGLEFGQMFRRFGSQVSIIHRGKQLLVREDADVAEAIAALLREDGITLYLKASPLRVEQVDDGNIQMSVQTAAGEQTLSGTHLLMAAGRTPNADELNLEAAGVEVDSKGFIKTNEQLETNVPGIYALGDVKGGPAFTHISYDDFRIIRTNLLEHGNASIYDRLVPYTVFIDPQLGRVGMSETEAREQGRNIQVAKMPMDYVARALEVDESRGFMKAIVDADTQLILGCAILGIEGGEIMAMLQMAMLGKLPYTVLREAVFAHPTLAESLNNLFGSFV